MSKKYAFVKYTKKGQLIPGSLVITEGYPKETANGVWEEVPMDLCCITNPLTTGGSSPQRAFIKYTEYGKIIPGSLIVIKGGFPSSDGRAKWYEVPMNKCCESVLAFRILFDDITNADLLVGDASSVSDWNTFFDLPTNGSPFTSVIIVGNEVQLIGGSGITIIEELFYSNDNLISVEDDSLCIVELQDYAFANCSSLYKVSLNGVTIGGNGCFESSNNITNLQLNNIGNIGYDFFGDLYIIETISLPNVTSIGTFAIGRCFDLININLPICTNLGGTVGNNSVFFGITGNTITLTVPSALMTADAGNPDGDIVYLQANNTVTVVTV